MFKTRSLYTLHLISTVSFYHSWKHLFGIQLANPDYGIPSNIDILLGVDILSRAMHHGWWFNPPSSSSALKSCFSRVLTGSVHAVQPPQ